MSSADTPTERHVLVVLAHPDDETFGCGGTIAMYTGAGIPVTYVCATGGEMGRLMGKPLFATRESLRHIRALELEAACAALGIGDLRRLGIWDKTVEFVDPVALSRRVGAIIAELNPSLVITFHPVHGGHQDHCAIGAATVAAVAAIPLPERPRLWCVIHPVLAKKHQLPTRPIDIRPYAESKIAAVRAHASQSQLMTGRFSTGPDAVERLRSEWPHEHYLEWILTGRYRGMGPGEQVQAGPG